MTRKHFKALADQLRLVRLGTVRTQNQLDVWVECCQAVALACKSTSPNFDHQIFWAACSKA